MSFDIFRIGDAAIDRTYRRARLVVVETDAFCAFLRDNIKDVLRERGILRSAKLPRRSAGVDRRVGALRLACATIDAIARDRRRHVKSSGTRWLIAI